MNNRGSEISWGTLWRVFAMLVLVVFLYLVKDVLLLLFLSIIISSALDTPVDYLEKRKIPRLLGTLLLFITILGVLSMILYTVIPVGLLELKNLIVNLGQINLPILGQINIPNVLENLNQDLANWADLLFSGGASLFSVLASISGNLIMIGIGIILSFYLTIDRNGVEKFMRLMLPVVQEEYVISVYNRVRRKLGHWLKGQFLLILIVGSMVSLGLWILGVKYSLILGLFAGLLEIVPVVGPVVSGVVATLVALAQSPLLALYTVALFVAIQQLENHLLVPLVMKKTTGVSPVVVVISLLIGSRLAGFYGVVLAVPTVMIFQEILSDWEKYKLRARGSNPRLV